MSITLSGDGIDKKKTEFEKMLADWEKVFNSTDFDNLKLTETKDTGENHFEAQDYSINFYCENKTGSAVPQRNWKCDGSFESLLQAIRPSVGKELISNAKYGYVSPRITMCCIYKNEKAKQFFRATLIEDDGFGTLLLETMAADNVTCKDKTWVVASGVSVNGMLKDIFNELENHGVFNKSIFGFISKLKEKAIHTTEEK